MLRTLSTSEICGPAWEKYGSITVTGDRSEGTSAHRATATRRKDRLA